MRDAKAATEAMDVTAENAATVRSVQIVRAAAILQMADSTGPRAASSASAGTASRNG